MWLDYFDLSKTRIPRLPYHQAKFNLKWVKGISEFHPHNNIPFMMVESEGSDSVSLVALELFVLQGRAVLTIY